ncbi:tetratricopeptide repeat protein [bacterium]|nr:tetratricopeptide repeat protein [bacterium]
MEKRFSGVLSVVWAVLMVLVFLSWPMQILAAVNPVWTDGGLAAGDKTVGTAVRYMRIGMWREAEAELRKILGYRPKNHAAQFNLGICHEKKGQIALARRFYEKAIKIRPELVYCEALARLDAVAGNGAEFLKFMIPCMHKCDHGYAFARAGLWEKAEKRFGQAWRDSANPVTCLNRAVANEVLGNRGQAIQNLSRAAALAGRQEYDAFAEYLNNTPEFSMEMLLSLPALTTVTDLPVIRSEYVTRNDIAVRLDKSFDSAILSLQEKNSIVDILDDSEIWIRVRTHNQKEGYIPAIFLAAEPISPDKTDNYRVSIPYASVPETTEDETINEEIEQTEENIFSVQVRKDGNAVAVRAETSLLAEITGYVDPGRKIQVKRHSDSAWYEIVSGRVRGFIQKSYIEEPG